MNSSMVLKSGLRENLTKMYILLSIKYGGPYCGRSQRNDELVQSVRYWVSGVSLSVVAVIGKPEQALNI